MLNGTAGSRRRLVAIVLAAALAACVVAALLLTQDSSSAVIFRPETDPQTAWAACNANADNDRPSTFIPLSDAAAAARVTPEPETRPFNAEPYELNGRRYPAMNSFVPSSAAIAAFRASKTSNGQTEVRLNPYTAHVDGRDGMRDPSTDDLIQWAAHKWGIPENWLRAEYVEESYWNSFMLGDNTRVDPSTVSRYPAQARVSATNVYQSMGIAQVRWTPAGTVDAGTNPLRWESTAFNIDYQAAMVRFYYDNPEGTRTEWGDRSYRPCEQWSSIGGWNSPYPWHNAEQAKYISEVREWLSEKQWTTRSFTGWKPSSLPPGITIK